MGKLVSKVHLHPATGRVCVYDVALQRIRERCHSDVAATSRLPGVTVQTRMHGISVAVARCKWAVTLP